MMKVLIVSSSAQGTASVSNRLAEGFEVRLRAARAEVELVRRDVGTRPVPHLTADTVSAIRGKPAETVAERAALALSDALIAELEAADLIVIGAPMYNFGMPSTLKAWFDHVLRARVTFRYTESGPEGLIKGKKAIVIESRAGVYSDGEAAAMDSQEPHIRTLLSFIGIDEVSWVRAEGLAFGPEAAEKAVAAALEALTETAREPLKMAA
jgi:FMN-dependent NADH-azoreductase